jgi:hypothetical protein
MHLPILEDLDNQKNNVDLFALALALASGTLQHSSALVVLRRAESRDGGTVDMLYRARYKVAERKKTGSAIRHVRQ